MLETIFFILGGALVLVILAPIVLGLIWTVIAASFWLLHNLYLIDGGDSDLVQGRFHNGKWDSDQRSPRKAVCLVALIGFLAFLIASGNLF